MELITSLNGTVALQVSADDVMPKNNFMARELVDFIASNYQFAARPNFPPGIPPMLLTSFTFQSGVMDAGEEKLPIMQLSIIPNGDTVTAATTDIADTIMDDFTAKLDDKFGFRFAAAKKRRLYQSNIVVRFEQGVEEKIEAIKKIEMVLSREIKRPEFPFKIKRLAFGFGNADPQQTMTLDAIENSDFIIERRTNESYEENRYFCGAPVRTSELVKILEIIERELKA